MPSKTYYDADYNIARVAYYKKQICSSAFSIERDWRFYYVIQFKLKIKINYEVFLRILLWLSY